MNINQLDNIPQTPGVYLWKNKYENIIYIGKSKNLYYRMRQYFKEISNSYRTAKLVENIASFEYVITSTEKEALILERNLIEKYTPKYNIKLMDDKRYPYIVVILKDKLKISLVYKIRSLKKQNIILYGPFPSGFGARRMTNLLNRLATYKNGLPNKTNDLEFWQERFNYVKKILSFGSKSLLKELKLRMFDAAEKQQYEIAHDLKESIKALESYKDKQNVELQTNKNIDFIGFIEKNGFLSISLLFYRKGSLLSKNNKIIEITFSKSESIRQFISQYYSYNMEPNKIFSNEKIETEIPNFIPQKGTNKRIINIALKNAIDNIEMKLQTFIRKEELTIGAIHKLKKLLKIKSTSHIMMIDSSSTANTLPIAVIVSYRNGIKQKSEYKKFNLSTNKRLADVDYINQTITRYFFNQKNLVPDLLIVDGGIAQYNEIKKIIPHINLIALVKNDKHITKSLINIKGRKITINDETLLNFLKGIQKEVDRFAKYHHLIRRRTTLEGRLTEIKGIGSVTEQKLLKHFGSYYNIYNASISELKKIVSENIGIKIKKQLQK